MQNIIIMMYNYYKEDYKTNKFVECFIDVESAKLKKIKEYLKNRWGMLNGLL